jgi:hypothetical protein
VVVTSDVVDQGLVDVELVETGLNEVLVHGPVVLWLRDVVEELSHGEVVDEPAVVVEEVVLL